MARGRKTKKRLSGLGLPPKEHLIREQTFSGNAKKKLAAFEKAIDEKSCPVAFANLIDAVYNSGAAEAEAEGGGASGSQYKTQTVAAIKAFRAACKVES